MCWILKCPWVPQGFRKGDTVTLKQLTVLASLRHETELSIIIERVYITASVRWECCGKPVLAYGVACSNHTFSPFLSGYKMDQDQHNIGLADY